LKLNVSPKPRTQIKCNNLVKQWSLSQPCMFVAYAEVGHFSGKKLPRFFTLYENGEIRILENTFI